MAENGRIYNALVKFDRKCNVVLAPALNFIFRPAYKFGNEHHTLSTVFAANRKSCKLCGGICRILSAIDIRHCEKSYKSDFTRIRKKENEILKRSINRNKKN